MLIDSHCHLDFPEFAAELPDVIAVFYDGGVSTTSWAESLREFHQARREVLDPSGSQGILELIRTSLLWIRMAIARSL